MNRASIMRNESVMRCILQSHYTPMSTSPNVLYTTLMDYNLVHV